VSDALKQIGVDVSVRQAGVVALVATIETSRGQLVLR
jgi:hypothetical protein